MQGFKALPFEFHFSEREIEDLRARLRNTRLPSFDPNPVLDGWDYGVNLQWLRAMVDKWENRMDLKELEAKIKQWPHYQAEIESIKIHFIHVRSRSKTAKPLLLVHGWPGSFYEFKHLIDELANPRSPNDPAFHVVVPSLPGYAFSEAPKARGWTMKDNARIFNKLMIGLGYETYMCQGGDWGHQVCRYLGSLHTENCRLVHLNMCPAPPPKMFKWLGHRWVPDWLREALMSRLYTPVERSLCERSLTFSNTGFGYAQVQGTKPVTVGYSLLDSPVGHLAWLGEKWMEWSDKENASKSMFDDTSESLLLSEDMLANISIYWFTRTILTSFLPYRENRDNHYNDYQIQNLTSVLDPKYYISVPFGLSSFQFELAGSTKAMVSKSGKLIFYKEYTEGGHFAALDRPKELLGDIREFYETASSSWA